MNEGPNLHKSAFSLAALSLHFCNTFSRFRWYEWHLILICFYANLQQKPLLEKENGELRHIKDEMG